MEYTTIALVTFALTGELLWRTDCMADPFFCPNPPIRVSILNNPPFTLSSPTPAQKTGIVGDFFKDLVQKCFVKKCDNLTKDSFQMTRFNDTDSFVRSILDNQTQIAFPISRPVRTVLTVQTDEKGPPLIFKELIVSPGYSFIMDVNIFNARANDVVMTTLMQNSWPIIVFTFLLAGISGICVWILETFFNEEEFPRSFSRGAYEGFWWAFVSMTTVGYGDKTPRSFLGRLYGVIWILIGLIVIAVFTATATSALSISPIDLAVLEGKKIGVLSNTAAELEATQKGARKVVAYPSVDLLFEAARDGKLEGVFMDKYKATHYLYHSPPYWNLKVFKTFPANVKYHAALLESMARKLLKDDSCFKKEMKKMEFDDLLMFYLKPVTAYQADSDSPSIVSGESKNTQRFLLVHLGIFLGLILLGVIAELVYKKVWKAKKKVQCEEGDIDLQEVTVQPVSAKSNLKEVEDKLGQLVREMNKLQEQLSNISSQADGTFNHGRNSTHM